MGRLQRPLDPAAVQRANDEFYENHPEMVRDDGSRIPLSPSDPAQADEREEWREAYVRNGGREEESTPPCPPESPVAPCPLSGGAPGTEPPAPEPPPEEPVATLQVRWSKPKVTPDHNSAFPPASAPTDTVPAEAKVELIGETTNVPDGTAASMTIHHAATGAAVANGAFASLEVRGNKVVVPATGKAPEWVFDASHGLWDPWNKPYYYFQCSVSHQSLAKETPKDFQGNEAACLRVLYWHECIAESSTLSGVLPECNTVAGILNGVTHSKAQVQNLTTVGIPAAQYGSLLRNTYVVHQASHGNALKRSDNSAVPEDDPGESKYTKSEWRSIVHITPVPRFGDAQIGVAASVPSTPKYLYYASTCLTGWESSFADAMIARGTQNIVAFRRTIPDSEAPQMSQKFYTQWANTYKLDPAKIPECFFKAGADHYSNMKPILYGPGGGAIQDTGLSPLAIAAIVIGVVAVGVLVGVALYSALK